MSVSHLLMAPARVATLRRRMMDHLAATEHARDHARALLLERGADPRLVAILEARDAVAAAQDLEDALTDAVELRARETVAACLRLAVAAAALGAVAGACLTAIFF